jgi:putative methanogenesis marker protein 6
MIKTYVVMLSTDSKFTPSMLAEKAAVFGGIEYKETCYGLLLEGEEEPLNAALEEIKKLDPNRIFFKIRGYRIGDARICRAKRGGGPRAGYHMLGVEREALKHVSKALECEPQPEGETQKKDKLGIGSLKKIIDEETGGSSQQTECNQEGQKK